MICHTVYTEPVDDKLVQFVQEINVKIKPHQLEIRKALCEDTGSPFYVLVSWQAQWSTTYCEHYRPVI